MVRSAVDTLTGFPVSQAILAPRASSYDPAPYTAPYPFGPNTAEVDVQSFIALPGWMEGPHRYWRTSRPAERFAAAAVVLLGLMVGSAAGFASLLSTPDVAPSAAAQSITPVASPRNETLAHAIPATTAPSLNRASVEDNPPQATDVEEAAPLLGSDAPAAEELAEAAVPQPAARPSRRAMRRARARRARRRAFRRARRARRSRR